jgi:hypothetical protein
LRRHLLAISSYTDRPPSSMQPMHIHLSWFSNQNKIHRHSSIEAARLTLISIPGFSPKLHSLTVLVRSPVVRPHGYYGQWVVSLVPNETRLFSSEIQIYQTICLLIN